LELGVLDEVSTYLESKAEERDISVREWIYSDYMDDHYFPAEYNGDDEFINQFLDTVGLLIDEAINGMNEDEFWDIDRMRIKIFDVLTSKSAGGFKATVSTMLDKKRITLSVRKKNILAFFTFEDAIMLRDKFFKIRKPMEYGSRSVSGGKAERMIMVADWLDYISGFTIRDGFEKSAKNVSRFAKPTGNLLEDAIVQILNSSDPLRIEIDSDFSKFDGSVKSFKRRFGDRFIEIDKTYDGERTIGKILKDSMDVKYRQPSLVTYAGKKVLLMLDMIQSGELFTSLSDGIINKSFQLVNKIYVQSVLENIVYEELKIQGDDSSYTVTIDGMQFDSFSRIVVENEVWNIDTLNLINQITSDNSKRIGMETNDKGGIGNHANEYLKKFFILGYNIPNPKIQLLCTEKKPAISIIDMFKSLVALQRLMIERGYDHDVTLRYIICFFVFKVAYRIDGDDGDDFIAPYLSSIITPNSYGGPGLLINEPSLHVLPNYDLLIMHMYPHYIQKFKVYGTLFETRDDDFINDIVNNLFETEWDLNTLSNATSTMRISSNPLGLRINDPYDSINSLINSGKVKIALESERNLLGVGIRLPERIKYKNRHYELMRQVIENSQDRPALLNLVRRKDNLEKYESISNKTLPKVNIIEKLIRGIKIEKIEVVKDLANEDLSSGNICIASSIYAKVWYGISGISATSNLRITNLDSLTDLLKNDRDYPDNIHITTLLRIITSPNILYDANIFNNVLTVIGINGSLVGDSVRQYILNNSLSILLLLENEGYSSSTESLGIYDLSEHTIRKYFEMDEFEMLPGSIQQLIVALVFLQIQKDLVDFKLNYYRVSVNNSFLRIVNKNLAS
jgi:hypothetical protein